MVDSSYMNPGDACQVNPANCTNGLSFSIWEKITYDSNIMTGWNTPESFPRRYIVSTGAQFDTVSGTAYPGFALYHQVDHLQD